MGSGPKVLASLYENVLDYMKNRRVRLLDMFAMLSNEKKLMTVNSLQKSLPTIGVNSTREAIIYFIRALSGQALTVTYGLFAQGLAQHRRASRQTESQQETSVSSNSSRGGSSSRPGDGPGEKGRRKHKSKAKFQKAKKNIETQVQRRRSLAHELGTLKLQQVEDEIATAIHTSDAADMTDKVSADLKQHVQQFLREADENDAMYERLGDLADSGAPDAVARGVALQARIRSALRLGKVSMAIKLRHAQKTSNQIRLARVFARSVQGLFATSVDKNEVSAPTFNTFADQRIAQQLDSIGRDLLNWCNDSD